MTSIHIPRPWATPESTVTPESRYVDRRQVLAALGLGVLGSTLPGSTRPATASTGPTTPALRDRFADRFPAPRNGAFTSPDRPITPELTAATHCNFYELTLDKEKVWEVGKDYVVDPWKVEVDGLVEKPMTLDLEDLFTRFPLEERIYRFRCVERWSMVVPWTGFSLGTLISHCKPLSTAKYVRFVSVLDKEGLPGQKTQPWYPWPYFEGLRMDEAMHPLAFAAVGIYGHALPMQHGAPWRLVLPWKYGYKSPKSIVRLEFTREEPGTFWNELQPSEYGFYSNVDPGKAHPRWSQAHETDIGSGETRATLPYNGYAEMVSGLYSGEEF